MKTINYSSKEIGNPRKQSDCQKHTTCSCILLELGDYPK